MNKPFTMLRNFLTLGSMSLLLISCMNFDDEGNQSVTSEPANIILAGTSPGHIPIKPTITVTPTGDPYSSFPITEIVEIDEELMKEGGKIWAIQNYQPLIYDVLDLESGAVITVLIPDECDELIPNERKVECFSEDGELYLLDPITGEIERTPVKDVLWFNYSSNGRFIVYEYSQPEDGKYIIAVYDREQETERVFARTETELASRLWAARPFPLISFDGQHLVVVKSAEGIGGKVFEISEDFQYRQVGDGVHGAGFDIAWSPVETKLIYGAIDKEPEIAIPPYFIYLVDFEVGNFRLFAQPPVGFTYDFFYNRPIWSPDGSHIFLEGGPSLCIVSAETGTQFCHEFSGEGIFSPVWSPSGKKIVFALTENLFSKYTLMVLDITDNSVYVVPKDLELAAVDFLYWEE